MLAIHRIFAASAVLATCCAYTADFSFTGRFLHDDEQRTFTFTLSTPGTATLRTLSYAGGVGATGSVVTPGGFDPSLALYSDAGLLLARNEDGGCAVVAADPISNQCWDSYLRVELPAGDYRVVLTEYDNAPSAALLSDPFTRDGAGDFTGALVGLGSGAFRDFALAQRAGAYAVDILGVDSAREPASLSVVSGASFAAGPIAPNTILSLFGDDLVCASEPRLLVNGLAATVLYAGPGQINFVASPAMASTAPAILQLECGDNTIGKLYLDIADADPALFTANWSGQGQASVINQDYTYNGALPPAVPAPRGSIVAVYGTGFGDTGPADPDGLFWLTQTVTATVCGLPAEVSYAGLVPTMTSGLQQINVKIPEACPAGDAILIQIRAGWRTTQPGTTIAVR
jgi:uncharacterized protein (TIGR03437 family)